jgi:hypothetical protein
MDPIRLFISLPFQRDGTAQDYPDCIRDFRAPELNRYLGALREEIVSAAEGLEDCQVTELVFGVGSFCHIPSDDLEKLYQLIGERFRLSRRVDVTLQAAPRGFDFFRLTAAKHLNQALIRFLTPSLDEDALRKAGFCAAEEIRGALDVCFQAGYRRFCCVVSPSWNPTPELLRHTLSGLLQTGPCGFCFDGGLSGEQRRIVSETLGEAYRETPEGWFLPGFVPPHAGIDQIGCGLAAVTQVGEVRVQASSDLDFYCAHAADFEALVHTIP